MKLGLALLSVGVLSSAAAADVLFDNLYITDNQLYVTGNGATIGGYASLGANSDLQMVDDFVVPGGAPYVLTSMTADYLGFIGGCENVLVEIFDGTGGTPGETPLAFGIFTPGVVGFTDTIFGLVGQRMTADLSGAGFVLNPGTYFIGMQPITAEGWGNGDWYYQVANADNNPIGATRFMRDAGVDPDVNHDGSLGFGPYQGGYGFSNFTPASGVGYTDGDGVFKLEGMVVPAPGALALLGLDGLIGRRRR